MLLAARPWSAPVPFTRVWCLYEIHTAWREGVPVDLHISRGDQIKVFRSLGSRYKEVQQALGSIDARLASAAVEADKINILANIENSLGFDRFNAHVSEILKAALCRYVLQHTLSHRHYCQPIP